MLISKPEAYQIEIATNKYMMDNHKVVYWMPSSARNTYKMFKTGLATGVAEEIAMLLNMMSYSGFSTYVEQYLTFAWKQAPESPATGAPLQRRYRRWPKDLEALWTDQ
jgi:hypothetical protein